jgi:hypothetical protein
MLPPGARPPPAPDRLRRAAASGARPPPGARPADLDLDEIRDAHAYVDTGRKRGHVIGRVG